MISSQQKMRRENGWSGVHREQRRGRAHERASPPAATLQDCTLQNCALLHTSATATPLAAMQVASAAGSVSRNSSSLHPPAISAHKTLAVCDSSSHAVP